MIWEGEVFVNWRFGPAIQISLKMMLPFALAVWLTVKRKCWMSYLAHHNTFIAGAAGSGKSFVIKQISDCTTKKIFVTNTTGRAAKVFKKIRPKQSIHLRKLVTATNLKRYVVCFIFCVPWIPEDIIFWSILRGEAALTRREAPRRKK